jgi:uncharacterized RDD family membrane protein YckC
MQMTAGHTIFAIGVCLLVLLDLAVAGMILAGMWKVFEKAGQPGWAAIVPIYNVIVMLDIADLPRWWIVLYLIPLVNFVAFLLVSLSIAEKFGQSTSFGVGLALLAFIFWPILGFGDAQYIGPRISPRGFQPIMPPQPP